MPNRFIKESCRSSDSLAALSDKAERLYWRLVTVADDFGRFQADPEVVQSECYKRLKNRPSLADVRKCLQMIADANMVFLYENGTDRHYGYFVNWAKFQGAPRARVSKYPTPPSQPSSLLADASTCKQMLANAPSSVSVSVSESESESESDMKKDKTKRHGSIFPLAFQPNAQHTALATDFGFNVFAELVRFKDHHTAKGTIFKDWNAAFRNWLRTARDFKMKGKP
jgi:hypothetical protein